MENKDTKGIARVDYSAPPPGYLSARGWAHYKREHDPPGCPVDYARRMGDFGVFVGWWFRGSPFRKEATARTAAWTWHDRRHALDLRLRSGLGDRLGRCDGLDFWPRILTWTDEQVAEVERWLQDSAADMPEILQG